MKQIRYTTTAIEALRTHRAVASRIKKKIEAYAATGAGNVKPLTGISGKRLRVGDFRVLFEETTDKIIVTDIGPRGSIYR